MSNVQAQLRELRRDFSEKQREQIQTQTRIEEAKKKLAAVNTKIKEAGYEPKELSKVIAKKTTELEQAVTEISQLLEGNQDDEIDLDEE